MSQSGRYLSLGVLVLKLFSLQRSVAVEVYMYRLEYLGLEAGIMIRFARIRARPKPRPGCEL